MLRQSASDLFVAQTPRTQKLLITYGHDLLSHVSGPQRHNEVYIDIVKQGESATVFDQDRVTIWVPCNVDRLINAAEAMEHAADRLRGLAEELGDKRLEEDAAMELIASMEVM